MAYPASSSASSSSSLEEYRIASSTFSLADCTLPVPLKESKKKIKSLKELYRLVQVELSPACCSDHCVGKLKTLTTLHITSSDVPPRDHLIHVRNDILSKNQREEWCSGTSQAASNMNNREACRLNTRGRAEPNSQTLQNRTYKYKYQITLG